MKNVPISDEFFDRVLKYQKDKSVEAFEPVAKRMMRLSDLSPTQEKKIVLVGEARVGKSTLRQIFFHYDDPKELLKNSLEPTRGVEHFNYIMSDMNLLVIDTAGQELENLLEKEPELFFKEIDAIIYIVDASKYQKENKEIYDLLHKIENTVKFHSPDAKIALYVHKMDLLEENDVQAFKASAKSRHKEYELTGGTEVLIHFTSIGEKFIRQLEIAFLNLFYL